MLPGQAAQLSASLTPDQRLAPLSSLLLSFWFPLQSQNNFPGEGDLSWFIFTKHAEQYIVLDIGFQTFYIEHFHAPWMNFISVIAILVRKAKYALQLAKVETISSTKRDRWAGFTIFPATTLLLARFAWHQVSFSLIRCTGKSQISDWMKKGSTGSTDKL